MVLSCEAVDDILNYRDHSTEDYFEVVLFAALHNVVLAFYCVGIKFKYVTIQIRKAV